MHLQLSRIGRGNFGKNRKSALIALDSNDALGTLGEKRAGQAARPGTDLDNGETAERCCGPRYASREIEVEKKILAKSLIRRKSVSGDRVP
jgi:hypothetical protein